MSRDATEAQYKGYPGGCYKGYKTLDDAEKAWTHACVNQTINTPLSSPSRPAVASPSRPLPSGPLGPEDLWYTVVWGRHPGVYQGLCVHDKVLAKPSNHYDRRAAIAGLGDSGGKVIKTPTEDEANSHFVAWWMAGNIIEV